MNFYVQEIGPYFNFPSKNDTLLIERGGAIATQVITDTLGRISAQLDAGIYVLSTAQPITTFDTLYPQALTVSVGAVLKDTVTHGNPYLE